MALILAGGTVCHLCCMNRITNSGHRNTARVYVQQRMMEFLQCCMQQFSKTFPRIGTSTLVWMQFTAIVQVAKFLTSLGSTGSTPWFMIFHAEPGIFMHADIFVVLYHES
jgi:hypothetical protein